MRLKCEFILLPGFLDFVASMVLIGVAIAIIVATPPRIILPDAIYRLHYSAFIGIILIFRATSRL